MNKSTCSVDDCNKQASHRGWCTTHYFRWRRTGTTHKLTPEERFWRRVDKSSGCWIWTGAIDRMGYASVKRGQRDIKGHRYAWEITGHVMPDGLVLDHLCYNRACVNPAHLRAVTQAHNSQNRQGAPINSTTGVRGVSMENGKYIAQYRVAGKDYGVGRFTTLAEAEAAVIAARRKAMPYSETDKVDYAPIKAVLSDM